MYDLSLSTEILIVPALDTFLHLDLYQFPKHRVSLLLQCMLDVARPSPLQGLCQIPLSTPLQLGHIHSAFFANGHFRKTNFSPAMEGLDSSVSMYTICLMDTEAPSHVVAVKEVDRLHLESFNSSKSGTATGVIGGVNQSNMVWCLISVLVYMSVAIKRLAEFAEKHHPVLCTALEYMAKVLTSRTLQEKARSMGSISHIWMHFILNIIQGNIGAFFEISMGSEAKRMASHGTILITLFRPALTRLRGFEAKVMELFQMTLTSCMEPIAYTAEMADMRRSVAPTRVPTSIAAP